MNVLVVEVGGHLQSYPCNIYYIQCFDSRKKELVKRLDMCGLFDSIEKIVGRKISSSCKDHVLTLRDYWFGVGCFA